MIRFPSLSVLGAAAALATMLAVPAAHAGIEDGIQAVRNQKYEAAQKEFESLAAKDDARAMYYLGEMYFKGLGRKGPERLTAIYWWEKGAYLGDVECQLALGNVFRQGLGVRVHMPQAYVWDLQAAKQGNPVGEKNVGDYYLYGNGKPKDALEAAKWYRRAAMRGYPEAQVALANLLLSGDGIEHDRVAALVLFNAAAAPADKSVQPDRNAAADARILKGNLLADDLKRAETLTLDAIYEGLKSLEDHPTP